MALIAEVSFPTESFALAETLPQFPDAVVEAGKLVAHSPNTTMPAIWVTGCDPEAFAASMEADPSVDELRASTDFGEIALFQVRWSEEVNQFVSEIVDEEGAILEASGREDRWRIRLRFMTRDQFEQFQSTVDDWETTLTLEQLFEATDPGHRRGDVTPDQHRALVVAAEAGYFDVPRTTSTEEIAAELGVSHQAVSERIRRGTGNLVGDALLREPIDE